MNDPDKLDETEAEATEPRSLFPGFGELAETDRDVVRRLARHRADLGLSQTEIAARMGTSQSTVARIEAGGSDLRMSTLGRYAEALGATVSYRIGLPAEAAAEPGEAPSA